MASIESFGFKDSSRLKPWLARFAFGEDKSVVCESHLLVVASIGLFWVQILLCVLLFFSLLDLLGLTIFLSFFVLVGPVFGLTIFESWLDLLFRFFFLSSTWSYGLRAVAGAQR